VRAEEPKRLYGVFGAHKVGVADYDECWRGDAADLVVNLKAVDGGIARLDFHFCLLFAFAWSCACRTRRGLGEQDGRCQSEADVSHDFFFSKRYCSGLAEFDRLPGRKLNPLVANGLHELLVRLASASVIIRHPEKSPRNW
jgi:hypothetical protein